MQVSETYGKCAHTFEQQPPKIIEIIKTIVAQVGRLAWVAAASVPVQLFAFPRSSLPGVEALGLYCRLRPLVRFRRAVPLLCFERVSPLSILTSDWSGVVSMTLRRWRWAERLFE